MGLGGEIAEEGPVSSEFFVEGVTETATGGDVSAILIDLEVEGEEGRVQN